MAENKHNKDGKQNTVANKNSDLNKKNDEEGGESSLYKFVIGKMKGLWDLINHKGFWVGLGLLGGFLAFKHLIY